MKCSNFYANLSIKFRKFSFVTHYFFLFGEEAEIIHNKSWGKLFNKSFIN